MLTYPPLSQQLWIPPNQEKIKGKIVNSQDNPSQAIFRRGTQSSSINVNTRVSWILSWRKEIYVRLLRLSMQALSVRQRGSEWG